MIYLFCSASTPLYKRDALESISYPPGHLFRFRYRRNYVDPVILDCPKNHQGLEGVIVFLDSTGQDDSKTFDFYPIRKIQSVRLFLEGQAMYVDFEFGDFVNYGAVGDTTRKDEWSSFFLNLPNRPWPPATKSGRKPADPEGYFFLSNPRDNPAFPTNGQITQEAWDSLIARLDSTVDLKDSTFFQVLGFYRTKNSCWSEQSDFPITPRNDCNDSIYPLPMGKSVLLKLLFSRPSFDSTKPKSRRTLEITCGSEAFAGVSKSQIPSDSRYNEERVILVCKRVYDSFLSQVSIKQQAEPEEVQAPKPFFLITVQVPRSIVFFVVLGVLLSTFLVALDVDTLKFLGTGMFPNHGDFIETNAKAISAIVKGISTLPVSFSAYLAFRKLPVK